MNRYGELLHTIRQSEGELHDATLIYRRAVGKHQQLEENIVQELTKAGEFYFLRLDKRRLTMAARESVNPSRDRMGEHMGRNR